MEELRGWEEGRKAVSSRFNGPKAEGRRLKAEGRRLKVEGQRSKAEG
jgi:hypothetical protein